MSSPANKNARHLSETAEHFGNVWDSIHVKNHHSPKKGKGGRNTQNKNSLKAVDWVTHAEHKNSFHKNVDKSCIQTSSVETLHQREIDSDISCGNKERAQCDTLDGSSIKKSTEHENTFSQSSPQSLKEQNIDSPSKEQENVALLNSQLPDKCKDETYKMGNGVSMRTEIYETSESFPLDATDCSNNVDKKKERRKMVKKLAKDEKRKQHELEYKKNLQFPKGQRIQVIDRNTFQKILKDAGSFDSGNKKSVLNSEEFPALNFSKPNSKFLMLASQDSSVQPNNEKSRIQDKTTQNVTLPMKTSETLAIGNHGMMNKAEKLNGAPSKLGNKGSLKKIGKLPKKRDPIQIDILQCIKMVKAKGAAADPRKKINTLERRKECSLISGNELDSSNPQRSRGKKRENPKKKRPTTLKLVILHERELRNQLKKLQESDSSQAEKGCFGTDISKNFVTTVVPQLEQMKPGGNALDNEVLETVPQEKAMPQEIRYKSKVLSSEDVIAVEDTSLFLDTEDHGQNLLQRNLHIPDKQQHENVNEGILDLMSPVLCPAADILRNERKESCSIINLKQTQHYVGTSGDEKRLTYLSSNAKNHAFLHCSQDEHCNDSLVTASCSDPDTCNKPQQTKCMKLLSDKICDSSSYLKETMQKTELHSRKFRPYCDNLITPEINSFVTALIQDIVKFHDRQFERDPVKANAKRRHVTGLREVLKYLNLRRLKLIIIAPDMELIQGKGGICDIVEQLKEGATNQEIPHIFALHRRALGKITLKKVPVSCIGVINYDGTEKNFHSLATALQVARTQYQEALESVAHKDTHAEEVDVNKQVIEAMLSKLSENDSTSLTEQSLKCSETDKRPEE